MPIPTGSTTTTPSQQNAGWDALISRVRVQADVDITDVSDDEILKALIDAYLEVLADEPWPFLQKRFTFTTTPAVAEYSVAALGAGDMEATRIRRVQLQGVDLVRIEAEDYYLANPQDSFATTGGITRWWSTLEADTLALWPPPNVAATARVIYTVTPSVDFGPQWAERYNYVLVAGALVYVFQKIGDFDSAEVKKKEFSDGTRAIRSDAMKPNVYTPRFIGGAPEVDDRPRPPILVP